MHRRTHIHGFSAGRMSIAELRPAARHSIDSLEEPTVTGLVPMIVVRKSKMFVITRIEDSRTISLLGVDRPPS